jgi:hypothetical protein
MDQSNIVTVLRSDDVLFGRGSGPNDHEGNIKFRELVSARKEEYMATNHRQTKATIARSVVDQVLQKNGRFLKKLEPSDGVKFGIPEGVDGYMVVDDDTIMEKAKQALRQNREKQQKDKDDSSKGSSTKQAPIPARQQLPPQQQQQQQQISPNIMHSGGGGQGFDPVNLNDIQPEPIPLGGYNNNMAQGHHPDMMQHDPFMIDQPVTTENLYDEEPDGYQTYVTQLSDPDNPQMKPPTPNANRRSSLQRSADLGIGFSGGSRRGSLLSGRRDNNSTRNNNLVYQDSMQFGEVWRRDSLAGQGQSMQMSELMESFTKMSATGEMNSSADTIGTIEPIAGSGGASNMSILSNMSAISMTSTPSLFKSESNEDIGQTVSSGSTGNGGDKRPSSLGNSELWGSKNVQNLLAAPLADSGNINGGMSSRAAMMESTGTFGSMLGSMAMLPEEDFGTTTASEVFGESHEDDEDSKQV